jgi:lipopolysaccharide/colanic/teichoic acid biosynthesis glycosyltransferase
MSVDTSPLSYELAVDTLEYAPSPHLRLVPATRGRGGYERVVKPVFDVVLAAVLLVLFLPVIAAVALAVRINLGKGVIYRQERVGQGGRAFTVLKFRTMRHDRRGEARGAAAGWDGPDRRIAHKREDDPRHTPVGRLLRKLSLDELPQLVNVLRGEMSIVGPRPELVGVVANYEHWQHRRHDVKPGLTGLWQVTVRGEGRLMYEDAAVDLEYVERVSARTDVSILVRTVPVLLFGRTGS